MQLLIVHRDPEMGEALVQMVKSYTRHQCQLVRSDSAAMDWARRHQQCEIYPALQVLFFPNYPATEQRLEISATKVFPEPIEGGALLDTIERAEGAPPNAPDLFHVIDVLQMCCLSRRSGALQLAKESNSGLVFLRNGEIVHAETTAARGRDALLEIANWDFVEFAYERSVRPPLETIAAAWHDILIDAVTTQKEENAIKSHRQSA